MPETTESTWRDRALERSLRTARAKALSRSDHFLAIAMQLVRESGRADFTVQELVDRSESSLRSFYQHFSSKDELLLALLEETVLTTVTQVREETADLDALAGIEQVVRIIYSTRGGVEEGVNRTMSAYQVSLADNHGESFRRAFEPLRHLIRDLVERGVRDGSLRTDLSVDRLTRVVLQAVVGSALVNSLATNGVGQSDDVEALWEFCRAGLLPMTP